MFGKNEDLNILVAMGNKVLSSKIFSFKAASY